MTEITIFKSNDIYKGFEYKGHAGFAKRGNDVVCSAVSMLAVNCINSIEKLTDDGFVGDADEKKAVISFSFKDEPSKEAVILIESMILGLETVIAEYGKKYVRLEFKEV